MSESIAPRRPLLVDRKECARLLGVSERTVFAMTAAGRIPVVRMGRAVRYRATDIERFTELEATCSEAAPQEVVRAAKDSIGLKTAAELVTAI